jgi:hypothetical protein
MKSKFLVVAAVIFYFVSLTSNASAQKANHLFLFNKQVSTALQENPEFAKWISTKYSEMISSGVHVRAVKDFNNRFANVTSAKWYTGEDGIIVYFRKDSFLNRVYYDTKGNWQYSLIAYGEKNLPVDIRASVKSVYYDWTISHVEEIQASENTVYIVTVENKTEIRKLRLDSMGNMDIYMDLNKM